jgi:hypothetical protein
MTSAHPRTGKYWMVVCVHEHGRVWCVCGACVVVVCGEGRGGVVEGEGGGG